MKLCKKCGIQKEFQDFAKDKRYKSGRYSYCKKCCYQRTLAWIEKNREKQNANNREWQKKHNYMTTRYKSDPMFRLKSLLRSRLNNAIRGDFKKGSAVRDLGCTISELKIYLEGLFQPGMTWENYGYRGWHVDHKMPLAKFDLSDREQFLKAVHFTNLQPLWAEDNFKKGDKYEAA